MKKLLTVVLTALLSSASLSTAQTAVNAVVTAPGAQPMVMPLNVQLLPYGTVTIANGTYFIPNYEGTGISIYIQSPQTIRVATLEETVRYQAEWMRITQAISSGRSTTPAAAPQAASVPVMPQATPQAQTFPTSPAAAMSAPSMNVPTMAAALPVTPAPAMNWTAPSTAVVSTPAPTLANFPTTAAPIQQPAAPAPAAFPSANNLFQQAAFPTAPSAFPANTSAFPAAATAFTPTTTAPQVAPATPVPSVAPQVQQAQYTPTTTLVPEYLRVNFRGRGTNVTYSLSNTSSSQAMQIDPASLRAYQNGQPVEAQLAQRDSSGGTNGVLMPRAMLVGTISVLTRSAAPITITWQAKDTQGRVYPIAYAWMPE